MVRAELLEAAATIRMSRKQVAIAAESPVHQEELEMDITHESVVPATRVASGTDPIPGVAFGRYEVRRTLGAGGFGAVYLGHDTQLDRPVAIKVLHAASGAAGRGRRSRSRRRASSPSCATPAS